MRKIYLFTIIVLFWQQGFSQSSDQNYIRTRTFIKTGNEYMDQIQYYDGLGRLSQTVQVGASPLNGADLVSIVQYDGIGREHKNWLPVPLSTNAGQFVDTATFKSNAVSVYADAKPYSETRYEPSPLNRITDQFGAGSSWHNNNKRVTTSYGTNDGSVARFFVNESGFLQRGSNYAAGTLYKTIVTDEDGKSVTEFKDKLGRVVMSRKSGDVDTYYVYNDLDQLFMVLPPLASDGLKVHTAGVPIPMTNDFLKKYAYIYTYDRRGNQTTKKLPGCDTVVSMIYDKANRLIMSQDGNQKSKQQWLVNKYDILGRLLYTSILNREITSSEKNYIYDNVIIESYIGGADKGFAETGYTCIHFASELDLLTANYYDNYNFFEIWPGTITTDLVYMDRNGYGTVYAAYPVFGNNESGCKGLQTGSLQRVLGTNSYLYQVDYYDYRGRVIQSRSTNHLGGYDHVYNQYDFSGNLTKTLKEHNVLGQQQIIEAYTYTYDQALRLKTTKYKLNNNDTVLLTSNKYDKFGRLTEKKRHNNTDTEEFEYNPRGWTTKIKSGEFEENLYYNSPMPNNPTFSACYNGNIAASSWKYNGVINGYTYYYDNLNRLSSTYSVLNNEWADGLYTEYFSYDKQGNINNLQRWDNQDVSDILTLTYNGNRLKKVNDNGYSQNLYSIMEYRNLANLPTEFYYDANGNMTTDLDRNIVTIKYNLLNLPDTVQFANGNQIINQYDASGQKLYTRYYTVLYPEAVPVISTLEPGKTIKLEYNMDIVDETGVFYVNNYEYGFNGCDPGWYWIRRIHNPEGYFSQEPGTYQTFYYYRKDHLGNNREVWRASYTNGSTTYAAATEQKTQYYPSGLPWKSNSGDNPGSQPYKYGGKEFVEMHGLDEYDSDARWYYPAIMRTTTPDPLAEKYYDISPYAWCANNPVKFVDPDGRFPVWAVVGAGLEYGFQVYDNYKSGKSGYDAWVGDVDFLDVGLSAVNPTGKFKVAKTLLVEGTKAVVNITQNEQIKVNANIEEVVTNTLVNTLVDVGVGKVTDAGSKKAVQNANKEVYTANQKLKTAERQAQRSPNSTKKAENVKDAQSNVQSARNKQVRTQMLNSTIGQAPNVTQQGATIISNRALKDEEKNKR
ncbi:hypothetical protein SDC9_71564 [bioreactor metagenome]|uniref:DUF6443 domain-containing protein n=1 Tax=bioreactor metagenome TaxID=1076179 RepID=A0A644YG44_9ZZZZ